MAARRCCFKGQEGQLFEQAVLAGDVVGAGVALHQLVDEFWVNGLCHPLPLSLLQDDIYTKISKLPQAVKNTCNASIESKGFCFYKATNGIKRHLAVDTLGFPFFTHCTKATMPARCVLWSRSQRHRRSRVD